MFGEDALKLFVGDVAPINEKEARVSFNVAIECKNYKDPDDLPKMLNGKANVWAWMQEAITDAAKINRVPVLIFKWARTPIYAAVLTSDAPNILGGTIITNDIASITIYELENLLTAKNFWISSIT